MGVVYVARLLQRRRFFLQRVPSRACSMVRDDAIRARRAVADGELNRHHGDDRRCLKPENLGPRNEGAGAGSSEACDAPLYKAAVGKADLGAAAKCRPERAADDRFKTVLGSEQRTVRLDEAAYQHLATRPPCSTGR